MFARVPVTLTAALIGALLVPGPAFARTGSGPGSGGGGPACDAVTYGNVNVQPGFSEILGGGGVTCQFPVPSGTTTSGSGQAPRTEVTNPANPPKPNDPCVMRASMPVTLHVGGANGGMYATWKDPDGTSASDSWDDKYKGIWHPWYLHYNAYRAGNNDVLVPYKYFNGRYDQNLQCSNGRWYDVGPSDTRCEDHDSVFLPQGSCARGVFHQPVQMDNPINPPNYGYLLQQLDTIKLNLSHGAIKSSPANQGPVQASVYQDTKFWIEGVDRTEKRTFVITIPGTPDTSGRAIVYQYVVYVGLAGTTWNFDDRTGSHPGPNDPGTAATPAMSYQYTEKSSRGCQVCGSIEVGEKAMRMHHVTATLNYLMDVWAVWNNGAQTANPVHVVNLSKYFEAPVQPEDLLVGDVQGVPVSGP